MQIDWITVVAQIVNFLILVWLLQHFLYGPITRAMDRREQRIADRLREAAQSKEDAEHEARDYREKQDELESQRDRLLADARETAEEERKSLEKAAREDVEQRRQEWLLQLRQQQEDFLQEIGRQTSERFCALSRRAFAELANAELEAQMANVFIAQLEGLDKETRGKIAEGGREAGATVAVSSRFDLPAGAKRRITRAIHDHLSPDLDVDYRRSDEIECGIEMKAGSRTIAWSLDSYIDNLENELARQIGRVAEPDKQAAQ